LVHHVLIHHVWSVACFDILFVRRKFFKKQKYDFDANFDDFVQNFAQNVKKNVPIILFCIIGRFILFIIMPRMPGLFNGGLKTKISSQKLMKKVKT